MPLKDTITSPNAPHHLPAEAREARCSRSGACGSYAALWLTQPLILHLRPKADMLKGSDAQMRVDTTGIGSG